MCLKVIQSGEKTSLFASGSKDSTIKIWNLTTYECLKTLLGHTNFICDFELTLATSTQKACLVSCSSDATIRVWNLSSYECINVLNGHKESVKGLKRLPLKLNENRQIEEECLLSTSSDNTVKAWNLNTSECLYTISTNWEVSKLELCPI